MSRKKLKLTGAIIAGVTSLLLLVIAGWLLLNRQYVADQISVWSYEPSASVQKISDRIELTNKGEFYFYTTHPVVAPSADFNQDCPRQEPGSPILGCYSAGRIYIYDITNEQLDGIEEVTAAHEMLHAAWERMSEGEQSKLATLLRAEYQKHANDSLTQRMEYYERNQPGEFENELHSILATEVGSLSPELEEYYTQYFEDRQKIVTLHASYEIVFVSLAEQADVLYKELVELGNSIKERTTQYNTDVSNLSLSISSFNARADSGDFSSIAQFNQERAELVARSNEIEANRIAISADIETYNSKNAQYESIANQIDALNKSIDSIRDLQETPTVQ